MFFGDKHQKPHQTCSNISTLPQTNMFASEHGSLGDHRFGYFGRFSGALWLLVLRGLVVFVQKSTRWWQLKYFSMFTPNLGEDEPDLTSIFFFRWVG